MNNVLGIIAEYNPFHNGHLYHISESKRISKTDYVVVVMSGNFVQRGNTSLIDKWTKTEMALRNGADLIIELPTIYSISSAENFAEGAIKILDSLGVIDVLSFGSEHCEISVLDDIANILYNEPKEYSSLLNRELQKGVSFPTARERALMLYLNDIRRYANVLSSPNNILGIEYLKAIKRLKSTIQCISINRLGSSYNSISIENEFASATAIRELFKKRDFIEISKVMPKTSFQLLQRSISKGHYVSDLSCLQKEILYKFRTMSTDEINDLPDVNEGLDVVLKKAADSCNSLKEFFNIAKTRRFTQTRLQRICLYALLGITKKDMQTSKKTTPYIRVLGFNNKGKELISEIHKLNPKLSIVTSVKRFIDSNPNKVLKAMLETDIRATNIYTLGYEYDSWSNLDYTHKLITVNKDKKKG